MWTRLQALIVLGLVALSGAVRADDRAPPIEMTIDPCVRVDAATVERIVEIELGARQGAHDDDRVPHVVVSCREDVIDLHLTDPVTGKSLDRPLDASDIAGVSGPRLLALAISELVSASWVELVVAPQPPVAPKTPRAPPEVTSRVRERVGELWPAPTQRPWGVRAGPTLRVVDGGVGPLVGGTLVFARDFGSFRVQADVAAVTGTGARPTGEVRATVVDGSIALAFAPRFGALSLHAGLGARLGAAWLAGAPNAGFPPGGTVAGAVGGPLACAGASASSHAFFVGVEVEAGYAVVGVRGVVEGATPVDLLGGWVGGSAQIGVAF